MINLVSLVQNDVGGLLILFYSVNAEEIDLEILNQDEINYKGKSYLIIDTVFYEDFDKKEDLWRSCVLKSNNQKVIVALVEDITDGKYKVVEMLLPLYDEISAEEMVENYLILEYAPLEDKKEALRSWEELYQQVTWTT